jgi:hypothetical protein
MHNILAAILGVYQLIQPAMAGPVADPMITPAPLIRRDNTNDPYFVGYYFDTEISSCAPAKMCCYKLRKFANNGLREQGSLFTHLRIDTHIYLFSRILPVLWRKCRLCYEHRLCRIVSYRRLRNL